MKRIIIIVAFLVLNSIAFAFSGHISQNTVWSNDILITGDVFIDLDITLTIEAGVTVSFLKIDIDNDGIGDIDFFNNGQLLISGTDTEPVVFSSWEENPQAGDWYGVTHSNTASVYSAANNWIIRYASKGLTVNGKYITIEDLLVEECYNEGIFIEDSWSGQTSLTNVVLKNNGTDGLLIASNGIVQADKLFSANNGESGVKLVSNSNTTLQNSRIISNLESGIEALDSSITLINCSISFNDVDGLRAEASSAGSEITLEDCSINDNHIFGIHLNGLIGGSVDSCDITANGNAGIIILGEAFTSVNLCNVTGNGVNPQVYAITEQIPGNQLYSTGSSSAFYQTMLPISLISRFKASGYADHNSSSDDYYFYAYDTDNSNFWTYSRANTSTDTNYNEWFTVNSSSTAMSMRVYCYGYSVSSYNGRILEIEYDISSLIAQAIVLNTTSNVDMTMNWWGTTTDIGDEVFALTPGFIDYSSPMMVEFDCGAELSNLTPELEILTPSVLTLNPTEVSISWADYDLDDDAIITLGYTTETGVDGIEIITDISEDSITDSYTWDVNGITFGLYYIFGVIDDGINPPVTVYSPERVMVGPVTAKVESRYGEAGSQVSVPVTITNAHSIFGFIAWQFSMVYDPTLLSAIDVSKIGTLSESWSVNYNNTIPGQIDVSGYSISPLTTDGNLINVVFDVNEGEDDFETGNIGFNGFTMNDASIPVTQQGGVFTVRNKYALSGSVNYYNQSAPLEGVTVGVTGIENSFDITFLDGSYSFPPMYSGDYTFAISNENEIPFMTVTPFDASLTARYALNTLAFNSSQILAADVSGDNIADAYDSALMVQYAINLISEFPKGAWKFTPEDVTITLNNTYSRDFTAIVIGDPSGNYPEQINRTIPDPIQLPLIVDGENIRLEAYCEDAFFSTGMKLTYNSQELEFVSINTEFPGLQIMANNQNNGVLYLGGFSNNEINTDTPVFSINFNSLIANPSDATLNYLVFDEVFAGLLLPTANDEAVNPVDVIKLSANYPNPFNPETTISFNLKSSENATLSIYNQRGQLVKILVDKTLSPGEHNIVWRGKDMKGNSVASGVYLYKLEVGNYSKTRKMILMK